MCPLYQVPSQAPDLINSAEETRSLKLNMSIQISHLQAFAVTEEKQPGCFSWPWKLFLFLNLNRACLVFWQFKGLKYVQKSGLAKSLETCCCQGMPRCQAWRQLSPSPLPTSSH